MKFEIKHRWTGSVLFALEVGNLRLAVEAAVKEGADLAGADLAGAYLAGADLTGAYLAGAVGLKDAFGFGSEPLKKATPEESIVNLDKVREIVLDNEARLDMRTWHEENGWQERTCAEEAVCGTAHCLAGWLQVCATDEKVRSMPAHIAGIVSAPVAAKMFFRDAPETLSWLRERKYADEAADYA
jgi:hypothetical protein